MALGDVYRDVSAEVVAARTSNDTDLHELLTVDEVARQLNVPVRRVKHWRARGFLQAARADDPVGSPHIVMA